MTAVAEALCIELEAGGGGAASNKEGDEGNEHAHSVAGVRLGFTPEGRPIWRIKAMDAT